MQRLLLKKQTVKRLLKNKPDRKAVLLSAIVVLLFAAAAFALHLQYLGRQRGKTALVFQNGKLIREIDLSDTTEDYSFDVTLDNGSYNTIHVNHGAIGVTDTNCPDKVCQDMGMISTTGYPISCLPHKLIIRIENNSTEKKEIDAVAR